MIKSSPDTVLLVGEEADTKKLKALLDNKYPTTSKRTRVVVSHQSTQDGKPNIDVVLPILVANHYNGATIVFKDSFVLSQQTADYYERLGYHFTLIPFENYISGLMGTVADLHEAEQLQQELKKLIYA
jgi:hypothetical protein